MTSIPTSRVPLSEKVNGYPRFAGQIELRPEFAIFRRFGSLNAENLLYLQAELVLLEQKLQRQQKADSESGHARKTAYARNWYQLKTSENDGDTAQVDLVFEIRKTLKEYNDALIQQATILSYPEPNRRDIEYVQNYLHTNMGRTLCGPDSMIWGTALQRRTYCPDLIALHPRPKEDPFSNWAVERTIVYIFKCGCARFMKSSPTHGVIGYEDEKILKITYWITSMVASLIPISSIVILYAVRPMNARLGIIAGFNFLVSICLSGLTNAKRSEIFAVTAAFAAVQVVFVSADKT